MQEQQKPESKTLLRAAEWVDKTHPQIEFRGRLDSLVAKTVEIQILADELNEKAVVQDLEDLLAFLRLVQRVEVTGEPLGQIHLLGLSGAQLRHKSQQVKEAFGIDHPMPGRSLGQMGAAVNSLRAAVREVELSALRAFGEDRMDIAEGLNRLSSAVYIILCRRVSGWYEQSQKPGAQTVPSHTGEFEHKAKHLWQEVGDAARMVLSTSFKDRVSSRMMNVVQQNGIFYFQTD
ncbi:ethanolamine utilization cobalamin adenosyltransferase, partial [gut metagenome]